MATTKRRWGIGLADRGMGAARCNTAGDAELRASQVQAACRPIGALRSSSVTD